MQRNTTITLSPMTPNNCNRRFWSRVQKSNGCWIWTGSRTGSKDNCRYGNLLFNGRIQKAHRAVWQIANGPIPHNLRVLHRCDTPLCVRPDHLFLGSLSDNARDCYTKGRSSILKAGVIRAGHQRAQRRCKRGHRLGGRNLYIKPNDGKWQCRACQRLREKGPYYDVAKS